jgi:hypothetical protein
MTAVGTQRQIRIMMADRRFWSEAEVEGRGASIAPVVDDPELTLTALATKLPGS